jgi:hypothetical protein
MNIKKRIFGSIVVLAIAGLAAFNINVNKQKNELFDVSIANVEALAGESSSGACYQEYTGTFTCAPYWTGWYCPCGA